MPKIVECVPNFSEGQNKEVVEAISAAIVQSEGVTLLDVDQGMSTNRTVYTFVGTPDSVVEAALNAARTAWNLIDMSKQKGEHPRFGALDVCPFIPVQGVEIEECIYCAKKFGGKLAAEFDIPVYLYGYAASSDNRKSLSEVRSGEYEGLPLKLESQDWQPDFGPAKFVPNWGATATGVRKFLIAYNINVLSTKEQAHRIALNIREHGRGTKDQPGRLKNCQAIGWWLEEYNVAQVSTNLTDTDVTPMYTVYEEVVKDATELNLAVTGSQIVGLVPLKAMIQTGDYFMNKENLFILEEDQKIHLAINRLGLNSLGQFNPKEKIIEYILAQDNVGPLARQPLNYFIHCVAARTPAPGGGSVSATVASLGAALATMVGLMTYGKRQWEHLDKNMRRIIPEFHKTMKEVIPIIDADTAAFSDVMEASRLPMKTPEQIEVRDTAMQAGLRKAVDVPMNLAHIVNRSWETLVELAEIGNINTKSDLQIGARCLETAVWGAYHNVMTNVESISEESYKSKVIEEITEEVEKAQANCKKVLNVLDNRKPANETAEAEA